MNRAEKRQELRDCEIRLTACYAEAAKLAQKCAELQSEILQAEDFGITKDLVPLKRAAAMVGVSLDTARRWARVNGVKRGGRLYLPYDFISKGNKSA